MQIECVFFGQFREAVGAKTITRETDARTVGELLAELSDDYPSLDGQLLEGAGLPGSVAVTVDGIHVQHRDGLQTSLEDGAVMRITQAIHGG